MIHGIQIPDAVALVVQYDGILAQIVGQILLEDLVDLTVGVLEDHICGRIDCLDVTLVYIQILDAVATVENDHLRLTDHLCQQRLHVGIVHGEGGAVDGRDLLFHFPVPGKLHILEVPHAVILDNDTGGLILLLQFDQMIRIELLFLFNQHHVRTAFFKKCGIVLILTLFAEDEQGPALDLEIRLS